MLISEKDQQINLRMLRIALENSFDGCIMIYLNEETCFGVTSDDVPPMTRLLDNANVSEYEALEDLIIDDETLETEFPDDKMNLKKLAFAIHCVPISHIMFWQKLTDEDKKDLQYYRDHRGFNNYDPNLDTESFGAGMAINDRLSPDELAYYNGVERDDL